MSSADAIQLRRLTPGNRSRALALRVAPHQERYVSSVADSLSEANAYPQAKPWYRVVYADDEPVGFVMLSWNCVPDPPDIIGPWFLWKLLIDERHQGQGYGRAVIERVAGLIRDEGARELLTSHVAGDHGPAGFYRRLGFEPTGETDAEGEIILRLDLTGTSLP